MSMFEAALAGRRPRRSLSAAVLTLLSVAGTAAWAQTACDDALRQAQKSYDLGLFEDVPGQLAPCLTARTSRATSVQVHSLMARAYLAADDLKKAREEVSAILRLDSGFEPSPPPRFAELVAQVRKEEQTVQVDSVSKTRESLREAPATVIVITGEEIRKRGYLDLEQVLHDLPGFDISRTNNASYSAIYQRGYRSRNNDRSLFLVDGVEQNDITTNGLELSRQFGLSNIDRLEVVYGPASTMYGANAYTGVINIITKEPEALIAEGKSVGVTVQAASGGYHTRFSDLTLAGRSGAGNLAWSLSGRFYRSTERDLSSNPDWSYNFDPIDYKDRLRLSGPDAEAFDSVHPCSSKESPYFECTYDDRGGLATIELTEEGERLARDLDRRFIKSNNVHFADQAEDWSVYGKVRIANLTFGLESWRKEEGFSGENQLFFDAGNSAWAPRYTSFYIKYSRSTGKDLTFKAFTRYRQSVLDRSSTVLVFPRFYAGGLLGIANLVAPCSSPTDEIPPNGCPAEPWNLTAHLGELSSQIRSELSLVYEPSEKLNAVFGIEMAKTSVQRQPDEIDLGPNGVVVYQFDAQQAEHTDLAAYAQGSYRLWNHLKLVLGGRLDYNEINNQPSAAGFGALFTPRAALVYAPAGSRLVLKGIFAEAFKDPTDYEKFSVVPFAWDFPSGGLAPERVRNIELNASWQANESTAFELAAYRAHYRDIVAARRVAGCEAQFNCFKLGNHDELRIQGIQLSFRARRRAALLWGNYTYIEPFQIDPRDAAGRSLLDDQMRPISKLRIGDIATHQVKAGINIGGSAAWNGDLRARYVGARRTGPGTTVFSNPFRSIGSYTVADVALTYRSPLPGISLHLIVNNVFDRQYSDPGDEVDSVGAPAVVQAGRTIYLKASLGIHSSG